MINRLILITGLWLVFLDFGFCITQNTQDSVLLNSMYKKLIKESLWQDYDALPLADELLLQSTIAQDSIFVVHALYAKGLLHADKHRLDSAQKYYSLAQTRLNAIKSRYDRWHFYMQRALILEKRTNSVHRDSIVHHYTKAFQNAICEENLDKEINARNHLSIVYMQIGSYFEAMKELKICIALLPNSNSEKLEVIIYNNIGHIYNVLGLYRKGLEYNNKTLKIDLSLPDNNGNIISSMINLAESYKGLKKYDSALYYHNWSANFFNALSNQHVIGTSLYFKGLVFSEMQNQDSAIYCYQNALQYYDAQNSFEYFRTNSALSKAHLANNNLKEAKRYAQICLDTDINSEHANRILLDIFAAYNHAYALIGDTAMAYQYQSHFNKMYEVLYNKQSRSKIIDSELSTELKYQQLKSDYDINLAQSALASTKQTLLVLVFLSVVILGIVAFLIYRFRIHKQHNKHLTEEVKNRTVELESKNSILEEYAFINAHKLRAPVARILGLCNLVEIAEESEDIEDYVKKIQDESTDLDGIVKSITTTLEKKPSDT